MPPVAVNGCPFTVGDGRSPIGAPKSTGHQTVTTQHPTKLQYGIPRAELRGCINTFYLLDEGRGSL